MELASRHASSALSRVPFFSSITASLTHEGSALQGLLTRRAGQNSREMISPWSRRGGLGSRDFMLEESTGFWSLQELPPWSRSAAVLGGRLAWQRDAPLPALLLSHGKILVTCRGPGDEARVR